MDKLHLWLVERINNYLTTRGGCTALQTKTDGDTTKLVIQDVFGQSYEITIRAIGNNSEMLGAINESIFKRNGVGFFSDDKAF